MNHVCIALLLLLTCFSLQLSAQSEKLPALQDSLAYLPDIGQSEKFMALKASLRTAQVQHDVSELGEVCYRLGKFYNGAGYYKIARYWYLQSLRIHEPRGPSGDLVKLYIQLSGNYSYTSMFDKSKQYILLALNTARQIRNSDSTNALKSVYLMMGALHSEACRRIPKNRANQDYDKMNQLMSALPGILGNAASCDSSFYYFRLAQQKLRELKEFDTLKDNLANICLQKGDTLQAIRYFKAILADYSRLKRTHLSISTQATLAQLYIAINNTKQAQNLLDNALQQYNHYKLDAPALLQHIQTSYVVLYHQTGDYPKAFYYQKLSYEYLFQKLNEDRNGAIERLGIEYEAEKRNAEIKNQQKIIQLRDASLAAERKVMYGLFGFLVTAIGVGIAFYRLSQKNHLISEQNAALVKEQNHRVKNNLQVVSDLLMLQKFQLTDKVAHEAVAESQLRIQSIGLLHRRLYDNTEHLVAVELDRYIQELIAHILDTYGLDYIQPAYTIDNTWLSADQMLPLGLILTEVVTNSCKYALANHPAPELSIQAKQTASTVQLIVQDNGPGFTMPQGEGTTYGLKLIRIQTQQLEGTSTFKSENGTRFELVFTLKKP